MPHLWVSPRQFPQRPQAVCARPVCSESLFLTRRGAEGWRRSFCHTRCAPSVQGRDTCGCAGPELHSPHRSCWSCRAFRWLHEVKEQIHLCPPSSPNQRDNPRPKNPPCILSRGVGAKQRAQTDIPVVSSAPLCTPQPSTGFYSKPQITRGCSGGK